MRSRLCPQCGKSLSNIAAFCKHCGASLPHGRVQTGPGLGESVALLANAAAKRISATATAVATTKCPHCHAPIALTARFCGQCGKAPGEINRPPEPSHETEKPYRREPRVRQSPPGRPGSPSYDTGTSGTARAFGVASVILGALTFGVQWIAGLCCGWIGWPLGIAAIVCGILAIVGGEKTLGWVGIVLSVAMIALQFLMLSHGVSSLNKLFQSSGSF